MKRILLLLEDFNELLYIETLFKKLGLDAMGTQKVKGLDDVLMSFRPSVIILSETIRDSRGADILLDLKAQKQDLLGMILLNSHTKAASDRVVDAFISRPIDPLKVLKIVASWVGLNEEKLMLKIDKLGLFKNEQGESNLKILKGGDDFKFELEKIKKTTPNDSDLIIVQGNFIQQTEEQKNVRAGRFANALSTLPPPPMTTYNHKTVVKEIKEIRDRENDPEITDIDNERKAFVDALFKK